MNGLFWMIGILLAGMCLFTLIFSITAVPASIGCIRAEYATVPWDAFEPEVPLSVNESEMPDIFIAASNSGLESKYRADYICDGSNDQLIIQQALAEAGDDGVVGLSEGTFRTTGEFSIPGRVSLIGEGPDKTILYMDGYGYIYHPAWETDVRYNAFLNVSQERVFLKGFSITGHGWIQIAASHVKLEEIWIRDSFLKPQGTDWKINAKAAFYVNLKNQNLRDIEFNRCRAIRVGTFGFRNDNTDDLNWNAAKQPQYTLSNVRYYACEAFKCGSGIYDDPSVEARGYEIFASGFDLQEFIRIDGLLMKDCSARNNWMDGYHFESREADNIFLLNCISVGNGMRKLGMWGPENAGRGFMGGKNAVFSSCYAEGNANGGYYHLDVWNVRLEDCVDEGSGAGFILDGYPNASLYTNNTYLNCTSRNAGTYGFLLNSSEYCQLIECKTNDAKGDGTYQNYLGGVVSNCFIEIAASGGASPQVLNMDEPSNVYKISLNGESLPSQTPGSSVVVPIPGCDAYPVDMNGDGCYEDLNGNGRIDYNDVVLFYVNMSWIAANEPVSAFDCNGNGRIDFHDVVVLASGI